jgi:AcrR family transcriptional regulator
MATEGGYEAVGMREVATRANVALGTLYRYFPSKDALLVAAWVEWASAIERQVTRRPLRGQTPAERTYDLLRRATRALEREPRLAEAVLSAGNSAEPGVQDEYRDLVALVARLLSAAMAPIGEPVASDVRDILSHVWSSALRSWTSGTGTAADVYEILSDACHLLLDPRTPAADPPAR